MHEGTDIGNTTGSIHEPIQSAFEKQLIDQIRNDPLI